MSKKEAKVIYKAYKKFFGKEPNFNKENFMNLTIEIQAMAYILNEYGVNIGANGFCYEYTDLDMPMSMDIQDIVVGKLIGKSDDLNDDSIQYSEFAEKTISLIGSAIRFAINTCQNPIEELRKISNILYVKEYVLPSSSDEKIMEITKCTKKDLSDVERLIEIINQERCKDNFGKSNLENIGEMIDKHEIATPYRMIVNESGNGGMPKITKESRKKVAKSLINRR